MRQRVLLAMALANRPGVLIADEPTTALDVTTQAQILELLDTIGANVGLAVVLVTHDLGVVAGHADRVVVMYAGRVVEEGTVDDVFDDAAAPVHARSAGIGPDDGERARRAHADPRVATESAARARGMRVPSALRRSRRIGVAQSVPPLRELAPGHRAACVRAGEELAGER